MFCKHFYLVVSNFKSINYGNPNSNLESPYRWHADIINLCRILATPKKWKETEISH
jgi:hypothetical protein